MPFGGMLGSTFNFVFEVQMEKLQNGDRFYYLQRLDGLHLFGEMENNSFAAMIMRNTDATHLPSDVFSTPGLILEVDRTKQHSTTWMATAIWRATDPVGGGIADASLVIRNNPATAGTGHQLPALHRRRARRARRHRRGNDILIASIGDDTLYGDGGNDRLEGGFGNDIINGGDGDDIIRDLGGDDNIKAGDGNDVVHAGPGLDLVLGGAGQDFVVLGTDAGSEVFGGEGNDFIYGNKNAERILGNEGDDWIETGTFDGAPGDNFDEIFARDGIDGHDVFLGDGGFDEFIGEGGDDIMVGSPGRGKMAGMSGFDWATYKDNTLGVECRPVIADRLRRSPDPAAERALDAYEVGRRPVGHALQRHPDRLRRRSPPSACRSRRAAREGFPGSALDAAEHRADRRPAGRRSVPASPPSPRATSSLAATAATPSRATAATTSSTATSGSNVQIGVFAVGDPNHTGTPIELHNSMTTLAAAMFAGTINPGQLAIVREIRCDSDAVADTDIAMFQGAACEYAFAGNADGSVQVTHTIEDGDGSDKLRRIERLQFADGTFDLVVGTPMARRQQSGGRQPQRSHPRARR